MMIGGFLGAGKTTAILRIAEHLREQGRRIGLITNDQSYGLVDTGMLQAHEFAVEEITGGCFCCRFNSLVDASERLQAQGQPDVFIAEPVGSCTDLKATVDYPLRRMYGENYEIAPLTVLIDPIRAERILGLEAGKSFSEKVLYIYLKQLEEAEIIAINKIDLLSSERLTRLRSALEKRFPQATVMAISARDGIGLAELAETILSHEPRTTGAMDVDYDTYAEGEALLGWLNAALQVDAEAPADGNELLLRLAAEIGGLLKAEGSEVAHLKMTLTPDTGLDIAVANQVSGEASCELSHRLQEPFESGELIVNLRAEGDPASLRQQVTHALERLDQSSKLAFEVKHLEAFRPGRPTPTHRLAAV
jgi:G3E family GTPase